VGLSRLLLRHQVGALAATLVDFLVMIVWVELGSGSAVVGTGVGAASGATTNFLLGRQWIFRASGQPALGQAARYVLVSAGSLVLNALGQYVCLHGLGASSYIISRAFVALSVAVGWNFPLHRFFVFRAPREAA